MTENDAFGSLPERGDKRLRCCQSKRTRDKSGQKGNVLSFYAKKRNLKTGFERVNMRIPVHLRLEAALPGPLQSPLPPNVEGDLPLASPK